MVMMVSGLSLTDFSKQAHFVPVKKTAKPDHLARVFVAQIFRLHGMPETIVSDRDPRFTSLFLKAIWANIGTRLQFSSSFHPQTDGQSEIANSVVLDLLKSYISDQKTQWKRYLPLVEFAYNNTIHSSTGKAPFEIVEGAMKVPPFLSAKDKIFEADEYTRDLDTAFAKVRETLQKSQERQKKATDRHRRDSKLKENDWVLLRFDKARLRQKKGKEELSMRYYGPFQITEQINDISFRLRLPDTWKIHNVFHVNLWKTFGDVSDDGEPDEQPEVEANEEILVPEQVLAHKVTKKGKARRRFLIEFKNFPAFDAKWMEEEDLADTPQILKLYLEAFASGPLHREVRVGIAMAWVAFLQGMHFTYGHSDLELQNYALQAMSMLSFNSKSQTNVDGQVALTLTASLGWGYALWTSSSPFFPYRLVIYILRVGVVELMNEPAQKEFLLLLTNQLSLADTSSSMLVVILRTVSHLLNVLGEVPPAAREALENLLVETLSNFTMAVRVETALTIRALTEVDPSCANNLMSFGVTTIRALRETVAIERGDRLKLELDFLHGQSLMLGAILAASSKLPLGVPSRLPAAVLELAKRLVHEDGRNILSVGMEKEAGWLLIAAIVSSMTKEEYMPHRLRASIGQLRVSSHQLEIESGRARGIPREERICRICQTEVESEKHFVTRCPAYTELRERYGIGTHCSII
ncbi:hypothetical protein L7F22_010021 [Adiantum nelumboides]|nr:hypothetical protein [Adiantum nelumboides]